MARLWLGGPDAMAILLVVGGALLGLGIETAQHFWLPWRYSTWIDVVSNTVGTTPGSAVASVVLRLEPDSGGDAEVGVGDP
jgi:VanZ family protein